MHVICHSDLNVLPEAAAVMTDDTRIRAAEVTPTRPPERHLDVDRGVGMMGTDAALRQILQTVDVSLSGSIPEIRNTLAGGDVTLANRLLHGIKGYAPIFCADALVEQLMQVEGCSKTETAAVVTPLFAELAPKLEALLLEIRAYVAQA